MGERTSIGCLSHTPNQEPGLQPRHVPWLGIELAAFQFAGRHSIHWATPVRVTAFSLMATWYSVLWMGYSVLNQTPWVDGRSPQECFRVAETGGVIENRATKTGRWNIVTGSIISYAASCKWCLLLTDWVPTVCLIFSTIIGRHFDTLALSLLIINFITTMNIFAELFKSKSQAFWPFTRECFHVGLLGQGPSLS